MEEFVRKYNEEIQRFNDIVNLRRYWDWDISKDSKIQIIQLKIMNIIEDLDDKCIMMTKI